MSDAKVASSTAWETTENLICEAQEMDEFLDGVDHLPRCGVLYMNSSPCSCNLPAFRRALDLFIRQEARRELRRARRAVAK